MIRLTAVVVLIVMALPLAAVAETVPHNCSAPLRPAIPDGGEASESELMAAKKHLETYLRDADNFLVCLRAYENSLGEEVTQIDGHDLLLEYNQMVDDMYLAGDEFNVALRKFKAANEQP